MPQFQSFIWSVSSVIAFVHPFPQVLSTYQVLDTGLGSRDVAMNEIVLPVWKGGKIFGIYYIQLVQRGLKVGGWRGSEKASCKEHFKNYIMIVSYLIKE